MKHLDGKWDRIEFASSLLLFIVYIAIYLSYSFPHYLFAALYTVIFVAYVLACMLWDGKKQVQYKIIKHALFGLMLLLFVIFFIMPSILQVAELIALAEILRSFGTYFIFVLPLFFLTAFGVYLSVVGKKRVGAIFLAVGLCVSLVFFGYLVTYYQFGDEVLLAFSAITQMSNGMNPYTSNIGNLLYANINTVGGTLTTGNMFIGTMDYPSLYFLSFAPFYFISSPTLYALGHVDMKIETAVFAFLLILSLVLLTDKKKILKFNLLVLVLLALALGTVASVTTFLMIAIILIAYAKLDSKYVFIALGLAVSIQQQIWFPALLLIVYSFNNYGFRKGVRDLIGTIAVFLLINGYFIALNPGAYIADVFLPLGKILPFEATPLASALLYTYHVTLGLSGELVALAAVAVVLLLLYWNKKELIPILSLIPILFIFHSLVGYYTFFLFFLVFAMQLKAKRTNGHITAFLHRYKILFYSAIVVILAVGLLLTYQSHQNYEGNFNLSLTNQSVHYIGNSTIYSAEISYSNLGNNTVYLYLHGYSDNGSAYLIYGLGNESLIGSGPRCSSNYSCFLNVNRITLPENQTSYNLTAVINGTNSTSKVRYVTAILYNGNYVYDGAAVYNYSR